MNIASQPEDRLESVDLVLNLLELLAHAAGPRSLGDIARALAISKPRAHRHLRALLANGYLRQELDTDRYEITAKLMVLGEAVRGRLSFAAAVRGAMADLNQATSQAVTASTLVAGQVTVVELIHGRTLVQFAIRPGTVMDPERSAHGLVAAAFGTDRPGALLDQIRQRGWATAPGEIVTGVNALAAPVFGHDRQWAGTIAIVGSIDDIPAVPPAAMIELVTVAAQQTSRHLGYRADA